MPSFRSESFSNSFAKKLLYLNNVSISSHYQKNTEMSCNDVSNNDYLERLQVHIIRMYV